MHGSLRMILDGGRYVGPPRNVGALYYIYIYMINYPVTLSEKNQPTAVQQGFPVPLKRTAALERGILHYQAVAYLSHKQLGPPVERLE